MEQQSHFSGDIALKTLLRLINVPETSPSLQNIDLFVFGSIARKSERPSDVDILITYSHNSYHSAKSIRQWIRKNQESIEEEIGLPLNIVVSSHAELLEMKDDIGITRHLYLD